jgi:hypothetical protein
LVFATRTSNFELEGRARELWRQGGFGGMGARALGGFGGMDALCPSYFGLYTANPAAAFRFGWEDVWRGSD